MMWSAHSFSLIALQVLHFPQIFFMPELILLTSFCECAPLSHCCNILFTNIILNIHLVLSESMVWKRFSSSSSFRVPSEKKAWNSSRESFPSSARRQGESEGKKMSATCPVFASLHTGAARCWYLYSDRC